MLSTCASAGQAGVGRTLILWRAAHALRTTGGLLRSLLLRLVVLPLLLLIHVARRRRRRGALDRQGWQTATDQQLFLRRLSPLLVVARHGGSYTPPGSSRIPNLRENADLFARRLSALGRRRK